MKKIVFAGIIAVLTGVAQTVRAESAKDCAFLIAGECFDCTTPYILKVGNRENCLKKCPNRMYNESSQTCELLSPLDSKIFDDIYEENSVDMKRCKENGYFLNVNEDKCFPCDTKEMVWVKPDCVDDYECRKKCPNRELKYMYANITHVDVASVLGCPGDRPLMDKNFMCWSCEEPTPIAVGIRKDSPRAVSLDESGNELAETKRIPTWKEDVCGESRDSVAVGTISDAGFVEVVSYLCQTVNVGDDGAVKCRRCNGEIKPDTPQCAEIALKEQKSKGISSSSAAKVIKVRSK